MSKTSVFKLGSKDVINMDVVMDSGQVFSIDKIKEGEFLTKSSNKCCIVREEDKSYYVTCNVGDEEYWKTYFNLDTGIQINTIMSSGNKFLSDCALYSKGMVILKQDLWETLVSFIISQRKSIPAIKTSLNRIRNRFGKEKRIESITYKTFPTADDLKDIIVDDLEGIGLGYRGKYVIEAIKWWNENYLTYKKVLENGTREEHMKILKQIKGKQQFDLTYKKL